MDKTEIQKIWKETKRPKGFFNWLELMLHPRKYARLAQFGIEIIVKNDVQYGIPKGFKGND